MESMLNKKKVEIVTTEMELLEKTSKSNMKLFQKIDDQIATTSIEVSSVKWTKPTLVGAVILDLAKRYMVEFPYTKMKPNLELELLYSDTDSFIYAVKTEDIYEDFNFFQSDFDFSNYPSDHPLYSEENKKVVLKNKDEMGGKIVEEFVALKPKLYSILDKGEMIVS